MRGYHQPILAWKAQKKRKQHRIAQTKGKRSEIQTQLRVKLDKKQRYEGNSYPSPYKPVYFLFNSSRKKQECESEKCDGEPIQRTIEGCVFFRAVSSHNSKRGYPTTVRSFLATRSKNEKHIMQVHRLDRYFDPVGFFFTYYKSLSISS